MNFTLIFFSFFFFFLLIRGALFLFNLFFKFIFQLEYNCFTVLWWLLLYNMNQL